MPLQWVTRLNTSEGNNRLSTGVRGLDQVLAGGFARGTTCILHGAPGSGKTVLSNQIAFHRVAVGGDVVYMTLLAESHGRMLQHLRPLAFFDESAVGERVTYLSGYQELLEGASALLGMLQREVFTRRPELIVLDGITAVQELHGVLALRQFIHGLQVFADGTGTTVLLLSANPKTPSPEDAVVDVVVHLSEKPRGLRVVRELRVHKMRGSPHLTGRHIFVIDDRGASVFPRIDALFCHPSGPIDDSAARLGFGQDGLDEMLGGGIPAASSTFLFGATGTGKTLLGLSFLTGALSRGEPAAYYGFYEVPLRLLAAGESVGLPLRSHSESGRLHVDWQAPVELLLDTWAHRLLASVEAHRPTRIFIDGVNALHEGALYPRRLATFLTALLNELRSRGVTTMLSAEMHPVVGAGVHAPFPGLSPLVENTIMLRYVELRSQLYRLVSVVKVRGSAHQSAMREFRIDANGLHIASTFDTAEAILTGSAHDISARRRGALDDG
jgi:circadian clock protein KaiC